MIDKKRGNIWWGWGAGMAKTFQVPNKHNIMVKQQTHGKLKMHRQYNDSQLVRIQESKELYDTHPKYLP